MQRFPMTLEQRIPSQKEKTTRDGGQPERRQSSAGEILWQGTWTTRLWRQLWFRSMNAFRYEWIRRNKHTVGGRTL